MGKKKSSKPIRDENVVFRASTEEKATYEWAADVEERAVSDWIRLVLKREVKRLKQQK